MQLAASKSHARRKMASSVALLLLLLLLKESEAAEQFLLKQQKGDAASVAGGGLHFGAKVALSILMATVLLVASATLVDLNERSRSKATPATTGSRAKQQASCERLPTAGARQQQLQFNGQQLRDQRSPSLSSSNSSSPIYSSNNSLLAASSGHAHHNHPPTCHFGHRYASPKVSSAAVQRVGAHNKPRRAFERLWAKLAHTHKSNTTHANHSPLAVSQYEQNLQMLYGGSPAPSKSGVVGETHAPVVVEASLAEAQESYSWYAESSSSSQVDVEPTSAAKASWLNAQLLKQVFIAFSLRHSASLIFQHPTDEASSRKRTAAPTNEPPASPALSAKNLTFVGHRNRLSSLSSVSNEQHHQQMDASRNHRLPTPLEFVVACEAAEPTNYNSCESHFVPVCQAGGNLAADEPQVESIDSLHGLRFLSMIWIIVIHSYNLGIRWSFFSDSSSSLQSIYKTAASQLLSNGTFACDSFFFTGGFLLAYLAFPSSSSARAKAARAASSQQTIAHQQQQQKGGYSVAQAQLVEAADEQQLCERRSIESRRTLASGASPNPSTRCASFLNRESLHQPAMTTNNAPLSSSNQSATTWHQNNNNQATTTTITTTPTTTTPPHLHTNEFTINRLLSNMVHRYVRMMPLMMAIIGLSATLLRYLGEGPAWDNSTIMYDKWCRKNWWINALFLHNFLNRENMCLSHSWYSAVDLQLFLVGQVILFVLYRSKKVGLLLCFLIILMAPLITATLTLIHHLPAVPLMIQSVSEDSLNLYYGEVYIKPYCRSSPYLIGILLAYLMRTTSLGQVRLKRWQVNAGWVASLSVFLAILLAMQPAMNGQLPSELLSALYSALSRPFWACATGWMIFACITDHGGVFKSILSARCFVPFSRLTYPAFLIHPIVMAVFYGSRREPAQFSHYLMLYLILGHIVITYISAFILSSLFELPLLSVERVIKRALAASRAQQRQLRQHHHQQQPRVGEMARLRH